METNVSQEELSQNAASQETAAIGKKSFSLGKAIVGFFKEPPPATPIEDKEVVKKQYAHWRLRLFYSAFIGYVVFYLCKKNIATALPLISKELGYTNTELGILGSSLYFTYAIGKFINGVLADNSDVRKFLPFALAMSAVCNLGIVVSSIFIHPGSFSVFGVPSATILLATLAFCWGFNGWFQSMGFPAVAKTLTFWYSNNERGTKWALWSTSHQTGTFLSVIISGIIISHFGWKAAFCIPAIFAILISGILMERLRDKPTSLGLPDIERYREPERFVDCDETKQAEEDNQTYGEIFKKYILFNKTIWLLALAYIFVYIIRFGTEDWVIKYLVEAKKNSIELAALKLSCLPLFGIVGTIAAGFVSDKLFKGKRAPVNIVYLIGVVIFILALKFNPATPNFIDAGFLHLTGKQLTSVLPVNGSGLLDFLYIGLIGMFTYGPQMLIGGLCAIESSSKKVASAATGFTGSFGYVGAIFSGVGTGMVIDKFQWDGALYFWVLSALACIVLCLFLWHDENCKAKCKCEQ